MLMEKALCCGVPVGLESPILCSVYDIFSLKFLFTSVNSS